MDSRNLFSLRVESKAARTWIFAERFEANNNRRFESWCAKLQIASAIPCEDASAVLLDLCRSQIIALEESEASVVEDPSQIATLKHAILDSLRKGMRAFTVNKEGGTHFSFDGSVFRRRDFGDEPNVNEVYATDDAMLASLRKFFEWDARCPLSPRQATEIAVWSYVLSRLKPAK